MSKSVQGNTRANQQATDVASWKYVAFTAVFSACTVLFAERQLPSFFTLLTSNTTNDTKALRQCRPPLPNIFANNPILADQSEISATLKRIDTLVRKSFATNQIDGLAIGVVTSNGAIYETGIGALKANETDPQKRGGIDRNSIFRIASGSKLFVALETFLLREKGALQWFAVISCNALIMIG
jgi:CubicO group peptidase (beta-lactamase class C family)